MPDLELSRWKHCSSAFLARPVQWSTGKLDRLGNADILPRRSLAALLADQALSSGNGLKLVVGGHRLHGADILGWDEIPAILIEATDDEARQIEIDENLARKELTALERAEFLLLKLDITDERWVQAMKAIRDAIRPNGTREYVRFYQRERPQDRFEAVTITLSAA